MKYGKFGRFAWAAVFGVLGCGTASATSLNIDFGSTFGTPSSSFGAGAGQAGVWNTISASGTTALVGLSGAALPGVTLNLTGSPSLTMTGSQATPNLTADEQALVGDNFYVASFAASETWTVKLSGLENGKYTVYAYAPSNTAVVTSAFTINGAVQTEIAGQDPNTATSPLQLGVDYIVATTVVSNGEMLIESGQTGFIFYGLAGLQLVTTTPLPAGLPLFATGLGLFGVLTQRRKRRAACA